MSEKRRREKYGGASKRKRSRSRGSRKVESYRYELRRFLEEQANVRNHDDFWRFHDKYRAAESVKKPDFDRSFLLNFNFTDKLSVLYDRLPVLDRDGNRIDIDTEDFKSFLSIIRAYRDFQQKMKFAKLKQIRKAQKDLPIAQRKDEIIAKLRDSRVLLIAGDTGCGKSTQVPQYVLEAGYRKVACTQPRRIAAISLSKRVAHETLTEYGSDIGYQIKFEKSKRADTRVVFMTEGLLLRQASEEKTLNSYDCIILDEVHERHLFSDFLVGVTKCLLCKRADLRVILMSATINIELFENYFDGLAKVIVPGRLYPIEIIYRPIVRDPYEKKRDKFDCTPYLQIIQMVDAKYPPHQKGDMLIFLNGFSEMTKLADAVREYSERGDGKWIVLMLHSTLSIEEQDRVFDVAPEGARKCVISTNIAETSVTIDGIRFVVDSGRVNRMTYAANGGVHRLAETAVSQAAARQRSGRAGRTGPGVCYRLYSEEEYAGFEPYAPAEVHLVPLDQLLLYMVSLGLGDVSRFPFLERPPDRSLTEAVDKLRFIGAVGSDDDELKVTRLGNALSNLPVDLTIGKILMASAVFGKLDAVLALAAALGVQSPIAQRSARDLEAESLRRPAESTHGDPLTYLNLYAAWLEAKVSGERTREWARRRGLEEQRFYETTKMIEQFRDALDEAGVTERAVEQGMTSGERSIRHGELRRLRALRRELRLAERGARRRDPGPHDLRDVEFRIANDSKRIGDLLRDTSETSGRHVILLKLALASGLYPNVALADEHDTSERLFHTRQRGFVSLRPDSALATHPEVLELGDDDIAVPPPGYFSRKPLSNRHQIVMYQSILETKKVFLVNTFRMPALQTLLLFARRITTDSTLTKFVFDDFVSIDAPFYPQGKILLETAVVLRKKWSDRLNRKLSGEVLDDPRDLIDDLVTYTNTDVCYNIKRLLPADLKIIYKERKEYTGPNPLDPDFTIRNNQLSENVYYDCLVTDYGIEATIVSDTFECGCGYSAPRLPFFERWQHERECRKAPMSLKRDPTPSVKNSKSYECEICNRSLVLTPVEILRHKKSCRVN